jgi:hypothetical protein
MLFTLKLFDDFFKIWSTLHLTCETFTAFTGEVAGVQRMVAHTLSVRMLTTEAYPLEVLTSTGRHTKPQTTPDHRSTMARSQHNHNAQPTCEQIETTTAKRILTGCLAFTSNSRVDRDVRNVFHDLPQRGYPAETLCPTGLREREFVLCVCLQH